MLMPSIFGEDLFDDFMSDFPFFDDKAERRLEKKLYGRRGRNLMKTDVKETDTEYAVSYTHLDVYKRQGFFSPD